MEGVISIVEDPFVGCISSWWTIHDQPNIFFAFASYSKLSSNDSSRPAAGDSLGDSGRQSRT